MTNHQSTESMSLSHLGCPLSQAEFGARVFSGDIVVFARLRPIRGICRELRQLARDVLYPFEPVSAHGHFDEAEYLGRVYKLQQAVRSNRTLYALFAEALDLIGFDTGGTYWDKFILRVVPPVNSHHGGCTVHVAPHRDTWGVNIHQQVNWWAPIFPIAANRTIGFYPYHWHHPIPNTTSSWRFGSYLDSKKKTEPGRRPLYPAVPQCLAPPAGPLFRPVISPGDLMAFAGAHLHGSVRNCSGFTRISFEIRTVHAEHVRGKRAAPNIDNASTTALSQIFSNVESGEALTALPA